MLITTSGIVTIICFIYLVFVIVANWRLFEKAGEPGWACLIPFYSSYIFFKITTGNGWHMFICLIPIVGQIYYAYVRSLELSAAFGQGIAFGVGLFLIPYVFLMILAFGSYRYYGPGRFSIEVSEQATVIIYMVAGVFLIMVNGIIINVAGLNILAAVLFITGIIMMFLAICGEVSMSIEKNKYSNI